jgi:hypothetical protein
MNLNGVRVQPYQPDDFFKIIRRAYEIQTLFELPDPISVSQAFMTGPGYTAYVKDDILLCAGVMIIWKGLGEAWVVTSPLIHKYPILSTKGVVYFLNKIIKDNNLERVQAVVQKDHEMANRWIKVLGFKPEGHMPNYRAGKTFIRYAKVI